MALRDGLSWELMEGRTGWGIVGLFLLVGSLGITATVEGWVDPRVGHAFLIAFSLLGSTLSILYTRHSVRTTDQKG